MSHSDSTAAIKLLEPLHEARSREAVFPSLPSGKLLSIMAMETMLRRMDVKVTVHGFRSSFRDWVGDETVHKREVAEAALAHVVGDATERAYRRGDALQKRREMTEDWATYCSLGVEASVVVVPDGDQAIHSHRPAPT